MKTTIVKIDGNKIQAVVDNDVKEFELEPWVKSEFVKLGDAELTIKDEKVTFCAMGVPKEETKGDTKKPESKKTGGWEDDMVTFEILLTKAHALKEHFSIKTEMLAIDLEKTYALFKATVTVDRKDAEFGPMTMTFQGHGDATADNVTGDFIKPHFIRMAETRAIVRALRWYTNNGCAEEEK